MIYYILIVHWFADFVCQTNKMAMNKSTSWKWLSSHVAVYSGILLVFGPRFAFVNGLCHLFVDAVTSRVTSYLWKTQDRHNFFVVIGLDQLIHTAFLIYSMPLVGWNL